MPTERARWHALLGDADAVFEDLEEAFAERTVWLPFAAVYPDLEGLREDPRFRDLLERMGLR